MKDFRTPAQYRAILDAWRRTAPENDSAIFQPSPRATKSPRHGHLADELRSLLLWRALSKPTVEQTGPLGTFCNDNDAEMQVELSMECDLEIRPSVDEMIAAITSVECVERADGRFIPSGGDIEYGKERPAVPPLTGLVKPIARLGRLRLATEDANAGSRTRGSLTHILTRSGPIKPIDQFGTPKGSRGLKATKCETDRRLAEFLKTAPPRYVPGRRKARPLVKYQGEPLITTTMSLNDAREHFGLPLVPINDRPALPCGDRSVSECFVSGHIACNENLLTQDSEAGYSPLDRIDTQETERGLRKHLSKQDVQILDTALRAANFSQIGELVGAKRKSAERKGQRLLLATCKRLALLAAA